MDYNRKKGMIKMTKTKNKNEFNIDKAGAMLDKVKIKSKSPAMKFVETYIEKIDSLQKQGASLRNIFLTVDSGAKLGVTYVTFQRYVHEVRKEKGSPLYTPRVKKEMKKEDWNCEQCKNSAAQKYNDKIIFVCSSCKTAYDADKNGKISSTRFSG